MADIDKTFTSSKLNNISQCHSSYGKNNQLAKPKLDRWKDLNNAIIDWMNNDAIEETSIKIAEQNNFQFYDKIQKAILSDLFERFRTIYPKKENEFNHDFPIKEVTREINGEEYAITTYFQYEFIDEDASEFIKLKTAFNPEPELIDRAIISKLKQENEEFYIASLEREDLEEIEQVENPDEIIDQHFDLLENFLNNKQKRNPGNWCSMGCDMSSRCGQFPLINAERITNRIREVKVTKTNAIKLVQCERRAAWNVQYGIPKENYIEYESASLGTKFHDYSQSLLVKNNNFREVSSVNEFKELVEEHEDTETSEKLFKKYKELIEQLKPYKNLSLTKSEFNLGFTIVADGKGLKNGEVVDKKVATIFMGRADLAGRVDNKPLIIELKTRQEHPEDFLEAQLYALGASKLLKTDDVITLHIYISDTETKIKERSFSESELLEAEKKFLDLAEKSASWIPFNALSPKFKIGDWCQYCEFRTTCSENRISAEQQSVISLEEIVNKEKESLNSELQFIEKNKEKIFENQKKIIELQTKEEELKNEVNKKLKELNEIEKITKELTGEERLEIEKKRIDRELKILELSREESTKKIAAEMKALKEEDKILKEKISIKETKLFGIEEATRLKEELSKKYDDNLHPVIVHHTLEYKIVKDAIQSIFTEAGFGSNEKLIALSDEVYRNQFTKPITKYKPTTPYDDHRWMLEALIRSKDFLRLAPSLQHIKDEQRYHLDRLLDFLHEDHHTKQFIIDKDHIIEFGKLIIDAIESLLSTKFYSNERGSNLQKYLNDTKELVLPFAKL